VSEIARKNGPHTDKLATVALSFYNGRLSTSSTGEKSWQATCRGKTLPNRRAHIFIIDFAGGQSFGEPQGLW
jgi:hypothetical protein